MRTTKYLAFTIVAALILGVAYVTLFKGASTETLTATFADASPLEPGNEVRVDGVQVGTIKSISLRDGLAEVELAVEKSALPLHNDAKLTIQPINVLGENYVSINPGSPSAPFMTTDTIPLAQTSSAVQLQDVLNTFNDPTSTGLAAMVTTLGAGMQDGGQNVADAIKALAPTMNDLNGVGQILKSQNAILSDLVDRAAPVAQAVAGKNGVQLDNLVSQVRGTLQAIGDNQQAIEQTIQQLPSAITEARATLSNLTSVSSTITPTLVRARPLTSQLSTISDEIVNFSKYANPAFNGFGPLFQQADKLLKEAGPVAAALKNGGPHLSATTSRTVPVAKILLHDHLTDLMSFVTKWALSTNSRDGASHYFRGVVYVTPKDLLTLAGGPLPAGALGGKNGTGLSGLISGLTGAGTKPLNGLTQGLVGGLLGGLTKSSTKSGSSTKNGATGLTPKQENSLLGQLLGGI